MAIQDWREATIVMNGVELTSAESMTIRVALESFASDLVQNGLGDDKHGKFIAGAYLNAVAKIREKMYKYLVKNDAN